uniref:Metalloendopeptidase n=1 Tax=Panagrolaimus sp. PS1159 TaxID=55785 RepID=A0AC35GJN9_9BILA
MSVCTTGIPLDAVKKNLTKISDESVVVISDSKNSKNKDEHVSAAADAAKVIPELKNNVVDEKNETLNSGKTGISKPIKSGKGKSKKVYVDPLKATVGLRKKIKAVKKKLKAKMAYIDSDATLLGKNKTSKKKPQNKTLDLSDIDDVLPDRLKKKYGDFVKNGRGKSIDELANIRKKLRILRKITGPRIHSSKNNDTEITEGDGDSLLFQGDEELDAAQLDSIIASTARHYGVDMEPLKKFGVKSRPKRQAILAPNDIPVDRLWPKTKAIKYYYDDDITPETRSIIEQAFTNLENQTCLWFKEDEIAVPRIQFVNFGDACASPVGYYKDSIHKIKIAKCLTNYGTISHEILHVLGIKHQQARYDRDDYLNDAKGIEILDETNSDNFGSPYDYGSVMHYGRFDTTQKLYDQTIGHRVGPSFIDIAMINQRYNCFCKTPTVTCLNGGYPNPNDCDSCICQHGYGSRTCGEIDPGTEDESEVINVESDECQTFEKSLGIDNNIRYNYYKKVWYHFKAPPGKKVQFIFLKGTDADLSESDGCDDNGIEVKITKSKFNRTGFV